MSGNFPLFDIKITVLLIFLHLQARGTFDNVWLAQVTGSTTVNLLPVDDCEQECEKFEFTLNQGDVCEYILKLKQCISEPNVSSLNN